MDDTKEKKESWREEFADIVITICVLFASGFAVMSGMILAGHLFGV